MMPLLKSIHNGQKFFVINFLINFDKKKLTREKINWMNKIIFSKLWKYNT